MNTTIQAVLTALGFMALTSCVEPNPAYQPPPGDGQASTGDGASAGDGGAAKEDPGASCGDGRCDDGESGASCPDDCPPCPAGATRCLDQQRLRYCEAGTWRERSCTLLCTDAGYDYATGCNFDPNKGKSVCRCGHHASFGQPCQDKQPCAPGLICATFGSTSAGFCTRTCSSSQDCLPAPAGSDSRCSLLVGQQPVCGFHCVFWGCPAGLSCDLFSQLCKA
jgi:hypothetical protein